MKYTFTRQLRKNKWLIGAVVFFVLWKFFLISVLWQDRALPPEPDDSHNYIVQIASVAQCPGFHFFCPYKGISMRDSIGFVYLSYRILFGSLAKMLSLTPQEIYHFSFYFGTVCLAFALPFFLKIFSHNKNLVAWSVFFLSFYHGLGETHGFFWVVPSFFSVLLLFILTTYIARTEIKLPWWIVFLLAISFTFFHPMSAFFIFIVPLYLFVLFLFRRKIDRIVWKRMLVVISIVFFSSLMANSSIRKTETEENAYSLKGTLAQAIGTIINIHKTNPAKASASPVSSISNENGASPIDSRTCTLQPAPPTNAQIQSETFFDQRIRLLSAVYFRWVFPHWICVPVFLFCITILVRKHAFEILSFYLAALLFFVFATFLNPYGYRSAVVLWPATFIFFAFSSWYFLETVREKTVGRVRAILITVTALSLFLFFFANAVFALVFNENRNEEENYSIEPALIQYLVHRIPSNQTVALPRELMITELPDMPFLDGKVAPYEKLPDHIIITNFANLPPKRDRSRLSQAARKMTESAGLSLRSNRTRYLECFGPVGYVFEKEFGMFDIYRKE